MRKFIVLILISSFFLVQCTGNRGGSQAKSESTGTADIAFNEYEYDFGKITEGEKVSHQFVFENKGPGDLVLKSVSTTCGCTASKYTSKPVKPGETGSIEVLFDASDRNGMQTKTITVNSNAKVPVVLLRITAEVMQQ
ncbi:MAG TPA: DUF1573 domain-containing protein [Bacteroidales bacterium]|nr:DUF1573 domain-containing protein [Bacteroidales bacterium]